MNVSITPDAILANDAKNKTGKEPCKHHLMKGNKIFGGRASAFFFCVYPMAGVRNHFTLTFRLILYSK